MLRLTCTYISTVCNRKATVLERGPLLTIAALHGGQLWVEGVRLRPSGLGRLQPLEKGRLGSLALFFTDVVSLVLLH